jgi:hypothetical protein
MMIWGLNPGRGKRFSVLQKLSYWLRGQHSPLFSGYWGFFLRGKAAIV